MGGICGWIGTGGPPPGPPGRMRDAMLACLAHRGGPAWLDWPSVAGASSDPSGGVVADSRFNTPEALNEAWSSWSSDAAAFASRLSGSFAVAALDARRGVLLLCRDRLGERPLYYVASPAGVAFASEIKALRAAGAVPDRALLPEALDAYLAFTHVPAPWTMHAAVRKVPAGHCVTFDLPRLADGRERAEASIPYWRLPARVGESASPDRMLGMLDEALGRLLPVDGRVAAFLSGGLDSSLVAALAVRAGARPPTFTAGFGDSDRDELSHARRVASLLKADHHEVMLRDADPDLVVRVIDQLDEPMADAATIPTYALAGRAASHAPVVLTGDAADALLVGDHWFRRLRRLERLEALPRAARLLVPAAGALAGSKQRARYQELVALLDLQPAERYLRIREKWTWDERREIYAEPFRGRVDPGAAAGTYLLAPVGWGVGDTVDAAVRLDSMHGLPEDLLMKADKMCGAHAVESRSPFLDQRFVEWAARLEIGLLLRGSSSKDLLKRAAAAVLPRDIVYRRKQGLRPPIGRWMKGSLRDLTERAFSPGLVGPQGIFDAGALARLKRRFETEPPTSALDGKVWQIVAFQTWWLRACEDDR